MSVPSSQFCFEPKNTFKKDNLYKRVGCHRESDIQWALYLSCCVFFQSPWIAYVIISSQWNMSKSHMCHLGAEVMGIYT